MAITLSGTDGVDQADVSGATTIPRGTTAERPANPADGMIRYNTDEEYIEYYNSDRQEWLPSAQSPGPDLTVQATGGTVTDITDDGINYRVHTFTAVGTSSFQVTQGGEVEYLVVAGGGGGGLGTSSQASTNGGGGAGGYRSSIKGDSSGGGNSEESTLFVQSQSYPVVVGDGGIGGQNDATNGGDSSFNGIFCIGGGHGGSGKDSIQGAFGGSGGGGGWHNFNNVTTNGGAGTQGQGFSGADAVTGVQGGGGGGASEPGQSLNGGNGISSRADGIEKIRAGGGGGAVRQGNTPGSGGSGGGGTGAVNYSSPATSGLPNTGGGGGGGENNSDTAGDGGSGIVIIRYPI